MENIRIMISKLGHYDSDVANDAKNELLLLRKHAVPHLVVALTNPDQVIVAEVARLLGLFRKDAAEAVEALVTISYLNNTKIRANAIASLALIAEKAGICIPVLKRYTTDNDVNVRRHAIAALGVFGYATHNAMFELVTSLKDEDSVVREFAAGILNELGSVPLPLVPQIVERLNDDNSVVRQSIIRLLGKVSRNTGKTIAELVCFEEWIPSHINLRKYDNYSKSYPKLEAVS